MTTPDALHEWLDRHGADASRWPAAGRDAIDALLASSSEARAALALARDVERALDADELPVPSPALRRAILAQAPGARRGVRDELRELWLALGGMRIAGPALAGALVLGTSLGAFAAPEEEPEDIDIVEAARLVADDPEI